MTLLTYLQVRCQMFNFSLALITFPPPTSKAIHYMNSYCRKQPTSQSFPSGCSNLFWKDKVLKRLFWLLGVTWGRARQGSYWPAQVLTHLHKVWPARLFLWVICCAHYAFVYILWVFNALVFDVFVWKMYMVHTQYCFTLCTCVSSDVHVQYCCMILMCRSREWSPKK